MTKNLFVTLADKNYLDQIKQLFSSIYFNAGWNGDCMLLSHEIADSDLEWFQSRGILVKKCEPFYSERLGYLPAMVFDRLYLFTEEFRRWDHIVCLEGDILVRDSIDALTKIDGFGAVRIMNGYRYSLFGQFYHYNQARLNELKAKFDLSRPALNAGVLAFPTNIITEGMTEKFRAIIDEYKDIMVFSDETVFNIYFYNHWIELPAVYNVCPSWEIGFRRCRPDDLKGIILHGYSSFFRTPRKIWFPGNPVYEEWQANLAKADQIDFNKPMAIKGKNKVRDIEKDSELILNLPNRYFYVLIIRSVLKKIGNDQFWEMIDHIKIKLRLWQFMFRKWNRQRNWAQYPARVFIFFKNHFPRAYKKLGDMKQ